MPWGVWLRVTALHYPGVPEQARTGRAREPKYLYQKGWDEEETGLESDPASQGGAGTRDKDNATGASREDQSRQEEEKFRLVTATSKPGEQWENGWLHAVYSSSISGVCRAVLQGWSGTSCSAMVTPAWSGKPWGCPKESKHCQASWLTRCCQYWNQSFLLVLPRRSQTWRSGLQQKTNPTAIYPQGGDAVIMLKDKRKRAIRDHSTGMEELPWSYSSSSATLAWF